jgi:hypothetical protein
MNATLYNGNSSTQTVNNSSGFYPDFNWIKIRSSTGSHVLVNSVVGGSKQLFSNLTNAEQTDTNMTSAISASGIALGNNTTGTGNSNITGYTYVLWQWLAGAGSSSSNTNGSITSTVSVNTTAGFSVVTYTGNGTAGATVGHGLGVAPEMIIVKNRSGANYWIVWQQSLTSIGWNLYLNATDAQQNDNQFQAKSSTTFTIASGASVNTNGNNYVAYVFAAVAGYSAFGSYTGNGSTDGPFVYTGFRPRFILIKCSSNSTSSTVWTIFDTSRSPYNASVNELYANLNSVESVDASGIDILSNGFKPKRNSEYANTSGWTYIYMAFAENPFKYSSAR